MNSLLLKSKKTRIEIKRRRSGCANAFLRLKLKSKKTRIEIRTHLVRAQTLSGVEIQENKD